jgi:hypothetical protein
MEKQLEKYLSKNGLAIEGMNSDTITISIQEGTLMQMIQIIMQGVAQCIYSSSEEESSHKKKDKNSTKKKKEDSSQKKDKIPSKKKTIKRESSSEEEKVIPKKKGKNKIEEDICTSQKKRESSSEEEEKVKSKYSKKLEEALSYSEHDNLNRITIKRDKIRKRLDAYPEITEDLITNLFHKYDDLFLDGYIKARMKEKKLKLEISANKLLTSTAGCVSNREGKIILKISIPVLMGVTISTKDNMLANTDTPVVDRLDALMQIIEHELVHIITLLYPPAHELNAEGKYDIAEHHGSWFVNTVKILFGHTRVTHMLTVGKREINIKYTKADFTLGQKVYFTDKAGNKQKSKIIKINPSKALVLTDTGLQYRVPYVILHPL